MKKLFKTILSIAALTTALGFFASCGEGVDDADIAAALSGAGGGNLTKTSIVAGLDDVVGNNVWDSGSNLEKLNDGTYKSTATTGGSWGGNICVFPICFDKGALKGFTHIVIEADTSNFNLGGSDEYPGIELKLANSDDSKTKVINATSSFSNGKAEVSITKVDILDDVEKIQVAFRGTGYVIVKDISKAK